VDHWIHLQKAAPLLAYYLASTTTTVSGDDHAAGHAVLLRRRRSRILLPQDEPHLHRRRSHCPPTSTLAVAGTRSPGGEP